MLRIPDPGRLTRLPTNAAPRLRRSRRSLFPGRSSASARVRAPTDHTSYGVGGGNYDAPSDRMQGRRGECRAVRATAASDPVKRAADIVLSALALLLLVPLLAPIAVLVRLTLGSPVLFRQTRPGLGERGFTLIKFRSMREDAEAVTGPVWASPDDRRRTRIGTVQ